MVLVNDLAWKDDESPEEHQKMKDMLTIKFWQDLKEPSAYKDLYQIAIVAFQLYGRILKKPGGKGSHLLASKTAVMNHVI